MKWIEQENREAIIETLGKKALTFGELLEMQIVSRTALSSHLDKLEKSGDIQKKYDSQRKRVVYQLRSKAITELMAKSMKRLHKGGRFGRLHSEGPAMLIIEHKLTELMKIVDRVIVLNFGEVIAQGTPEEIAKDKKVIEAYTGKEVLVA